MERNWNQHFGKTDHVPPAQDTQVDDHNEEEDSDLDIDTGSILQRVPGHTAKNI